MQSMVRWIEIVSLSSFLKMPAKKKQKQKQNPQWQKQSQYNFNIHPYLSNFMENSMTALAEWLNEYNQTQTVE